MEYESTEERIKKLLQGGLGLIDCGVQSATRVGEQKADGKYATIVIFTLENSEKIRTVLCGKKKLRNSAKYKRAKTNCNLKGTKLYRNKITLAR